VSGGTADTNTGPWSADDWEGDDACDYRAWRHRNDECRDLGTIEAETSEEARGHFDGDAGAFEHAEESHLEIEQLVGDDDDE
jgi:hypothetical protein